MRVNLSEYLPEEATVVFRVDAQDVGARSDAVSALVTDRAMWHVRRRRSAGSDGFAETVAETVVQIPDDTGYMPYAEYVAQGCPEGRWTVRPGDRVVRGAFPSAEEALASELPSFAVSAVRRLDRTEGFAFRGRRGALAYARCVVIEGA